MKYQIICMLCAITIIILITMLTSLSTWEVVFMGGIIGYISSIIAEWLNDSKT